MMKGISAAVLLLLLASQHVAVAEEASSTNIPCTGFACLLAPLYRVGKSILTPPTQQQPTPVSSPDPAQTTDNPPPAKQDQDAASPPKVEQETPNDNAEIKGQPAKPAAVARVKAAAKPRIAFRPHMSARRRPIAVAAKETVAPAVTVAPTATVASPVTIAANEPELARMLALASVVRAPTIRVVRAEAGPCKRKPVDFVVDTLQDLSRLGPAIPLFSESLIILSQDGSSTIKQLRGRRVSFGLAGSNSQQIAQRLFSSQGISVQEVPLDVDNALDALYLGDIDAVALLVPSGYDRLAKHDPRLRLVSLGERIVPPDGLRIMRIDPTTYLHGSWPHTLVSVVTVDAVLSPNQNSSHDASTMSASAMSVYAALDRNAADLARNGFDLIGDDTLVTMRSVAKDVDLRPKRRVLLPAFAQDGC